MRKDSLSGIVWRMVVRKFRTLPQYLANIWLQMSSLPWRTSERDGLRSWYWWTVGWVTALAGMSLGALVAASLVQRLGFHIPPLLQQSGLTNMQYQGAIVIAFTLIAGILLQVLGWLVFGLADIGSTVAFLLLLACIGFVLPKGTDTKVVKLIPVVGLIELCVVTPLPLIGVAYALYRYFTWVGPGKGIATVAFVATTLVPMVLIPLKNMILADLAARACKGFMRWLHRNNPPAAKPS